MSDNIKLKNITIEIDPTFLSIRIQATEIDIFEILIRSLKAIVSEGTPISLKQICSNHPSSSQQMISKIISKASDIEKCLDETRYLASLIRR